MTTYSFIDESGETRLVGSISPAPGGGSQSGAFLSEDFLFTEVATSGESYAITAVDTGAGTFTIAGDHAAEFVACDWFGVQGSTGNDAFYGIVSAVAGGGSTVITTDDTIFDATADGAIWPSQYQATLALPAGSLLDDVRLYPLAAPWAADQASIFAFDDQGNKIESGVDLVGVLTAPFDPAHPQAGSNYVVGLDNGVSLASRFDSGGSGLPYLTDAVVTLTAVTTSLAPVVPVGVLLVKVTYWTPITAVNASHP